jgi:hypothetical protein
MIFKTTLVIGSVLATAGIVCFFALTGQIDAETIRAVGSVLFSIGVLIISGGLYIEARRIQMRYEAPKLAKPKDKKTERLCSSCNRDPSVVFCRVHVVRLCPACFEKHDDGKNCSYVPARRATAAYR